MSEPRTRTDETDANSTPARQPARRRLLLPVAIVAILALGVWGVSAWNHALHHQETDDAQVEGHIIPVLARVGGYASTVLVHENQAVQQGDTLVVLDDRDLRAKLEQAQADLAVARTNAGAGGQAEAQLRAATAMVAQAQADAVRADADLTRYRSLAARNIISQQQLDAAEAAASSAKAALAAARDRAAAAAAQAREADSRVLAAQAALDQVALQLSYSRIVAPDGGVVARKGVEVGQLVQPGQPLLAVVPLNDVWIVANLKETQIKHVRLGNHVEIEADAYPGTKYRGHVDSVSPATGAKFSLLPPDNATGNFVKVVQRLPVKILLDEPNDPSHPLRPGMSVQVSIATGR